MRPLRIQAKNCKTFKDLDLDVSGIRHAVVVGANGAGKSLLIDLIRIALFDVGRLGVRALAGLIGPWGDTASVVLDFEHGGRVYRSTRTRRQAGKTTSRTDVVQILTGPDTWETTPLSIESIVGMSAPTSSATTFLRSRGADGLGDFGAASPEERRAILYELRRANRYEKFEAAAKERAADARRDEKAHAETLARLDAEVAAATAAAAADRSSELAGLRAALDADEAELAALRARQAAMAAKHVELTAARAAHAKSVAAAAAAARRVTESEARIKAAETALADKDAVRAAASQRAELEAQWRTLTADHRTLSAEHALAREHAAQARADLARALAHNTAIANRERLQSDLDAALARVTELRAVVKLQEDIAAAEADLARSLRREELQAEVNKAGDEVAELEPVLELLRRVGTLQGSLDGDERWAAGLAAVPCRGEGEYAACSYLTAAVAARERLAPLRADVEAAMAALATADGGRGNATKGASAVDAALTAARRKLSAATATLASVATALPADVYEGQLATLRASLTWTEGPAAPFLAAAEREATTARAQLGMVPPGDAEDVSPLERAVAEAVEAAGAKAAAMAAVDAKLAEIKASGESVRTLAARLSEIDAAEGALATETAALAGLRAASEEAAARVETDAAAESRLDAEWQASASAVRGLDALAASVATARRTLSEIQASAAGAEAARSRLETLEAQRAETEAARSAAARRVAVAVAAARFYSEAPALIVENDRAVIERAANDWLSRTSAMSVELVMQRPLKGDATKVRETLDVDVTRPSGTGVREGCSAGELFRVDIGLALAIGAAVGAGKGWIVIDEGFGTLKQDVLTSVARELGQVLRDLDGLWVVEHNPLIIDQFPVKIVVTPGASGSTVTVEG